MLTVSCTSCSATSEVGILTFRHILIDNLQSDRAKLGPMSALKNADEYYASKVHECSEPRGGATIMEVGKGIRNFKERNVESLPKDFINDLTSRNCFTNLTGERSHYSIWWR